MSNGESEDISLEDLEQELAESLDEETDAWIEAYIKSVEKEERSVGQ